MEGDRIQNKIAYKRRRLLNKNYVFLIYISIAGM